MNHLEACGSPKFQYTFPQNKITLTAIVQSSKHKSQEIHVDTVLIYRS